MTMDTYRAHHGVSQSALKLMAQSPAHCRYHLDYPEPSTPDQIWGTLFDIAVFDITKIDASCHVKPAFYTNKQGGEKKWNGNATECKEWIAEHQDRPIISKSDYDATLEMRQHIFEHPAVREALLTPGGKTGYSMFCEDAETGLQLKSRPDWISGNVILDLKSCQDASADGFAKTVANFGYAVQAAFYLDMAKVLDLWMEHFVFIACEKDPPYAVAVYELDDESIEVGRRKYRKFLNRYMECVARDRWPGYPDEIQPLSLPAWAMMKRGSALAF